MRARTVTIGLTVSALATAVCASLPTSAAADTLDPFDAAIEALTAADHATRTAISTGVDVISTVRFSGATSLRTSFVPSVAASVPARSRVRVHLTTNADGTSYASVRRVPSGRLIGGAGRESAGGAPWATVSMLVDDARATALSAGARDRTALTGIADGSVVRDSYIVEEPSVDAARLILPPYSGAQDEGWTTVTTTLQADGTTLISGSIRASVPASDGEDRCVRPLVEMVVGPDGVTRSSHWIETCPGRGTREYRAVATYGPQSIQPPTRPRMAAASVLD